MKINTCTHPLHGICLVSHATRLTTFQTNKRHEMNYMRILVWYDKLVIVLAQSSNGYEG